jgi:hypothetical protein
MMRNKVLSALDNPGEIANTQLCCTTESKGDVQPGRIAERLVARGRRARRLLTKPTPAKLFGNGQIEAEQVASVGSHPSS